MPIYATQDYDGDRIERDAAVVKFDTLADATAWLLKSWHADEWDRATAVIAPGQFSDAWLKRMARPRVAGRGFEPFSYTQLQIQSPGEHPGGRQYWVTPWPDVLVVAEISQRSV